MSQFVVDFAAASSMRISVVCISPRNRNWKPLLAPAIGGSLALLQPLHSLDDLDPLTSGSKDTETPLINFHDPDDCKVNNRLNWGRHWIKLAMVQCDKTSGILTPNNFICVSSQTFRTLQFFWLQPLMALPDWTHRFQFKLIGKLVFAKKPGGGFEGCSKLAMSVPYIAVAMLDSAKYVGSQRTNEDSLTCQLCCQWECKAASSIGSSLHR